ncbi:MAG TPA: glycosyltransferase [Rhodothermales bacterium]|nr:glycosyltransferase [Rhodothermales bacterium]
MRKVLIVSPIPTHPANAGNRARIKKLCEALRELGHDVYLLHVRRSSRHCDEVQNAWGDRYVAVDSTQRSTTSRRLYRRVVRAIRPDAAHRFGLDEWYDPAIDAAIGSLQEHVEIDTVIAQYVFMSRALLRFSDDVLKVLDTHDVFANRHRSYLSNDQRPHWYSCSARAEIRGLNRADTVLAIQEDEAAYFRTQTKRPVMTIGHSVDLKALPTEEVVAGRILAVGSENPINVESLNWFVTSVLPKVQREVPAAELAVAGSICNVLDERPGVRLLGTMENLEAAYLTAQVVVNPMRFGTGLKIKSLEPLGYARALVTTPVGAAGLSDGSREAFLEEGDDQPFADRVIELLKDPTAATRLGHAGYRYAARYNDAIRANLIRLFGARVR